MSAKLSACIQIDARDLPEDFIKTVARVIEKHRGNHTMFIHAHTSAGEMTYELGDKYRFDAFDPGFPAEIEELTGQAVTVSWHSEHE